MRIARFARYEQFLLLPQCFQKTSTADTMNVKIGYEQMNSNKVAEIFQKTSRQRETDREILCNKPLHEYVSPNPPPPPLKYKTMNNPKFFIAKKKVIHLFYLL